MKSNENFNPHENLSNEQLWNEIFQKSFIPGAQITIEQDGDIVMRSLPLTTSEIQKTELYADGRLQVAYREPSEGDLRFLINSQSKRPVVNSDFSIISYKNTIAKDYNAAPADLEIVDQVITIQSNPDSNVEKPSRFFHGSIDSDIEVFTPRTAPERPDEQAAVYVSPDIRIAKQSMANQFTSNGGILNGTHFICIPMSKESFKEKDKGGYIYTLPNNTFNENEGRGFGKGEWVSTEPVKALDKKYYPSIIQEMKRVGVQVYFINPNDVELINSLQDGPPEKLQAYLDKTNTSY